MGLQGINSHSIPTFTYYSHILGVSMTPFQSPTEAIDPRCEYLKSRIGTPAGREDDDAATPLLLLFAAARALKWSLLLLSTFAKYLPCCAATCNMKVK